MYHFTAETVVVFQVQVNLHVSGFQGYELRRLDISVAVSVQIFNVEAFAL